MKSPSPPPPPGGQVREPSNVKKALAVIRAGVGAALQRSCSSPSRSGGLFANPAAGGAGEAQLPPISARDLLEGTCLRFDKDSGRGVIGVDELRQVGGGGGREK